MSQIVEEGVDYLIAPDPKNSEDWCVILKLAGLDRVVGKYNNIEITEKGSKVSFEFHPMYTPEDASDIQCEESKEYLGHVLVQIMRDHHEKQSMVYYSKETGEQVSYE